MWFVIGAKRVLRPFDKTASEFVDGLTIAEPIEMQALLPREAVFHRHMTGVLEALADALHTTPDMVRASLLMDTGNFTPVGKRDGSTVIAVNSTSRNALPDLALRTFWDEAKAIIVSEMLPCIKDDTERRRIEELLSLEPA
jgi:hypothetical protein